MVDERLKKLIVSLFEIEGVKFGEFTLKSGIVSPVYFDLRVIISYPEILKSISDLVAEEVKNGAGQFDVICGVPYTALPIASLISVQHDIPMVLKRKEQKKYGTGNLIEGKYSQGTRCLLIEDVVTSGSSVVETAQALRENGLLVDKVIVILDRCQGASVNLNNHGIKIKALIDMDQLLQVLVQEGLITQQRKSEVDTFLSENQLFDREIQKLLASNLLPRISCPISQKLVTLMTKKRSNLCLSVDLDNWEDVLEAADLIGPQICVLKTHVDTMGLKGIKIITEFRDKLVELGTKHEFLILEDRKFADIGSTVQKQLVSRPFEISKWADMVTVHGISGPGVLKVFQNLKKPVGVVLIAEMSSEGNLASKLPGYKEEISKMTQGFETNVAGFVSQSRVTNGTGTGSTQEYFLQFTPGVALDNEVKGDGLGQQYCTVEEAVLQRDADVIIVGRGILKEPKELWATRAESFRKNGWEAFTQKLKKI